MTAQNGAGGAGRGARGTRMECKVCWYVYDPAVGDDVWQIQADTPWSELPAHWSCPTCSTVKADFLPVPDD
jgi:rubredoxin